MKITKSKLNQIIKEETAKLLRESEDYLGQMTGVPAIERSGSPEYEEARRKKDVESAFQVDEFRMQDPQHTFKNGQWYDLRGREVPEAEVLGDLMEDRFSYLDMPVKQQFEAAEAIMPAYKRGEINPYSMSMEELMNFAMQGTQDDPESGPDAPPTGLGGLPGYTDLRGKW